MKTRKVCRRGAAKSDGVIHCAFDHGAFGNDFSKLVEVCEKDRRAIEALGDALRGSDRPLVITSGTGMGNAVPGQPATEDHFDRNHPNPRKASEVAGASVAERDVNVSVVRLSQVYDTVKRGLITSMVQVAREKGSSAYFGEGLNRWPAAHVLDIAHLYRLALEREPGSRYNAAVEEGVSMREIAEIIGRGLKMPAVSLSQDEAQAHFGWLAMFVGLRHASFKRRDPATSGMAPNRARTDCRSRTDALGRRHNAGARAVDAVANEIRNRRRKK